MKNNYKLFYTLSFIFTISSLFFNSQVRSDTTFVSGSIVSSNWTLAGSPYIVTGDISITGLIIDPGVSVLFAGNYEFLVSGVIEAVGTEQSQIIFTAKTGVSSWKGIRFQNSLPGSYLKWCIVEKANNSGIRIVESFPNLIDCTFRNNTSSPYGAGMYISNSIAGKLVIINCKIKNNETSKSDGNCFGGGIWIAGIADFVRCTINKNKSIANDGVPGGSSTGRGGGIYIESGLTNFKNCNIDSNLAYGYAIGGFSGNAGYAYGGGAYINNGTVNFLNSIIADNSISGSHGRNGSGVYCNNGQINLENSTLIRNNNEGLYKTVSTNVEIINSITYFNGITQFSGAPIVNFSCVQGGYTGIGNISFDPNLDPTCLNILPGSPCIDAGKDSIIYRDACILPPSLGNLRNDMGAHGGPGACNWLYYQDPPCTPWPVLSINIELTALMQGLYNPVTNMMSRPQSEILYLRKATCPFAIVEPASATLGQNGISTTEFTFNSVPSGTYYLVTKNWNSLETWSKTGGELLYNDDGGTYYYDFTTASTEAYGNNLIQIDNSPLKYGIYIGDVSQFGVIDLADVLQIRAASNLFTTGYNVNDLNGDYLVNLTDLLIAYNNSVAFVEVEKPVCAVLNP